jgi:Histidine kinase-like ATPase domain
MSTYTRTLPGVPGAACPARRVRCGPARKDAVLCVSELVTNAIQHSRSAGPAGLIRLRLEAEPGKWLQIDVQDDGPAPAGPAAPGGEHGRGLLLVATLADAYTTDGRGLHSCLLPWDPEKERLPMRNPSAAPALDLPESEALRGPQFPDRTDLDVATAASAAVLAGPEASREDRQRALETEEAAFLAYLHRPEAEAVLEVGI